MSSCKSAPSVSTHKHMSSCTRAPHLHEPRGDVAGGKHLHRPPPQVGQPPLVALHAVSARVVAVLRGRGRQCSFGGALFLAVRLLLLRWLRSGLGGAAEPALLSGAADEGLLRRSRLAQLGIAAALGQPALWMAAGRSWGGSAACRPAQAAKRSPRSLLSGGGGARSALTLTHTQITHTQTHMIPHTPARSSAPASRRP